MAYAEHATALFRAIAGHSSKKLPVLRYNTETLCESVTGSYLKANLGWTNQTDARPRLLCP
jgi:hypothetical protein